MPQSPLARAILIFTSGAAILLVGLGAWLWTQKQDATLARAGSVSSYGAAAIGGPFELVDQDGQTRRDKEFRGRYMLIYFGYTFCPDICPTSLLVMTQALQQLEEADAAVAGQVVPIFITIDPARDTVEALAAYAPHFHDRLVALTGDGRQVAGAAKAYRVFYAKVETDEASDYLMDHSGFIYLMDPEGRYLTHFTHDARPEAIVEALRREAFS